MGAYIDYYTADTVPFFDLYDFLICNTKRHYQVFRNHPNSLYLPWGTDIETYKPKLSRHSVIPTFIVSAGSSGANARVHSWMDRRGAGIAMRAFTRAKGDSKLIVFSQTPLDNCPTEWKVIVENDNRIEFVCGSFNPVPYSRGHVLIYPSRLDGIGLTVPEALSTGLPVIASNSPPMSEFVKHDWNGYLVDIHEYRGRPDGYYWPECICDEDSLIKAIQFYINTPSDIVRQSLNARSGAELELSWEKNAQKLSGWISDQVLVKLQRDGSMNDLEIRALKYDRIKNPNPIESFLISIKAMLTFGRKYISSLKSWL
jgi:glycosyltransferase involved in cell wall biosynthesis